VPREGSGARRDRRGHPERRRARVRLTVANTAIVLDSTADLPDAADRFPNWRVVPLYVRFADESLRAGVDIGSSEFYRRLRKSSVFPTTSQPTPNDFLACYREFGAFERILSLHVSSRVSGTFTSAEAAAMELGDGRVRAVDTETASASIAMLALAIQAPARAGHDRRGGRRARRALSTGARAAVHGRHARVPPAGRPHRQGGRLRGDAAAGEADPLDPRRRGGAGQARARGAEGARGTGGGARDRPATSPSSGWQSRTRRRRSAPPSSRRSSANGARAPSWSSS
jgi:hypothetical protein